MSPTTHQHASARGFSLVELITTVSIVAVMACFATPSMSGIMARHRVQDAQTDLFATLLKARSQAIMLDTDVALAPTGVDWASGWRVADPGAAGKFLDVHEPVKAVSITMSGASAITYQFNGRVRGGVGVKFDLSSSNVGHASRACVTVDPSGRPYTQDGPCAG